MIYFLKSTVTIIANSNDLLKLKYKSLSFFIQRQLNMLTSSLCCTKIIKMKSQKQDTGQLVSLGYQEKLWKDSGECRNENRNMEPLENMNQHEK